MLLFARTSTVIFSHPEMVTDYMNGMDVIFAAHVAKFLATRDLLKLSLVNSGFRELVMRAHSICSVVKKVEGYDSDILVSNTDLDLNYLHMEYSDERALRAALAKILNAGFKIHPLRMRFTDMGPVFERMLHAVECTSSGSDVYFCQFHFPSAFKDTDEVCYSDPVPVQGGTIRLFKRVMSTLRHPQPRNCVIGVDLDSSSIWLSRIVTVWNMDRRWIELRAGLTRGNPLRVPNDHPEKRVGMWTDLLPVDEEIEQKLSTCIFLIENSFIL